MSIYPASRDARDRFILDRRPARLPHDAWQSHGVHVEDERLADGAIVSSATIFLTGRECPWRCVMCDLWRDTTTSDTPAGAIAAQVASAMQSLRASDRPVRQVKLYNAGSFFDPHAVPDSDHVPVARALAHITHVVVESHPALVGDQTRRFRDLLREHTTGHEPPVLEVAMGLETAHPDALDRLNKRMTVATFTRAAEELARLGAALRVFLLISPPFVPLDEHDTWLLRSIDVALDCGASAVSLIPTRTGNGAMDALAAAGEFASPSLADVERSLSIAIDRVRGGVRGVRSWDARSPGDLASQDLTPRTPSTTRVFADVWDLERFAECAHCFDARRARLRAINLTQHDAAPVECAHCGGGNRSRA